MFKGKFDILELCLLDFWQTRDERIDITVRPVECKAAVYFVGAWRVKEKTVGCFNSIGTCELLGV